MRRRDFLASLGGTVAAWPLRANGQQPPIPVIGFLNSGTPEPFADRLAGFHRGLRETGFVEGQSLHIEYRWANGQLAKLPALAADLVRLQVRVIAATGNLPSGIAAKAATSTIPVVFISGLDPVKAGLVVSLNRPGSNATGVSTANNELGAKRLQILRDLAPGIARVGVLLNPAAASSAGEASELQKSASRLGLQIVAAQVSSRAEIDAALASLARTPGSALMIPADPFLTNERGHIIDLAARYRIPAIYNDRVFSAAGGLLSYGPSLPEGYRQVGLYTGLILKGTNPGDLPVVQPTKFELVVNLKTARTLGLAVPSTLLALADDVIE